jgi:thiamine kinase-like enzyme
MMDHSPAPSASFVSPPPAEPAHAATLPTPAAATTTAPAPLAVPSLQSAQAYLDANRQLRQALGISESTPLLLKPLAQGEYNINYRFARPADGREFVLRVNMGSQLHLEQQVSYEAAALRALAPSGCTPQVYYVDDSAQRLAHGVLVEDFVPGRPLNYHTDLDEAARLLAEIHALPCPPELPLLRPAWPLAAIIEESEELMSVYRASPFRLPEVEPYFERFFARATTLLENERSTETRVAGPRHIVSTELNAENFVIGEDGTGFVIDWEKPCASEVAQDLAHFLLPTTTYWKTDVILDRAQRQRFLERYVQAVAGRFDLENLTQRFDLYATITCVRALTWCAMAYTEYKSPNRALRNESTFAKIKEYLTPTFLTFITDEFFA